MRRSILSRTLIVLDLVIRANGKEGKRRLKWTLATSIKQGCHKFRNRGECDSLLTGGHSLHDFPETTDKFVACCDNGKEITLKESNALGIYPVVCRTYQTGGKVNIPCEAGSPVALLMGKELKYVSVPTKILDIYIRGANAK